MNADEKLKSSLKADIKALITAKSTRFKVWMSVADILSNIAFGNKLKISEVLTEMIQADEIYYNIDMSTDGSNIINYRFTLPELIKKVRMENINGAIEGLKELMEIYAKNEDYDKAAEYRDMIKQALKENGLGEEMTS